MLKCCFLCCFVLYFLGSVNNISAVPAVQFGCPIPEDDPDFCALVDVYFECESNADCKSFQKCCTTKCGGTACLAPNSKPGTCPRIMPVLCAARDPENPPSLKCGVDSECPDTQKCCQIGCGSTACKKIVPKYQFGCPLPNKSATICQLFPGCDEDSDCKKGEKCCQTCGAPKCVKTVIKPGVCPPIPKMYCIRRGDFTCGSDSECEGFKKCCGGGCGGTVCSAPAAPPVVKLGCPLPPSNFPQHTCKDEDKVSHCKTDHDCRRKHTCCPNPCGGADCIKVKGKKGSCPPSNPLIKCPSFLFYACGADSDCPEKQKCCDVQCGGIECTDAFKCKDKRKWKGDVGNCKDCSCKDLKKMPDLFKLACINNFNVILNCCKSCKKIK